MSWIDTYNAGQRIANLSDDFKKDGLALPSTVLAAQPGLTPRVYGGLYGALAVNISVRAMDADTSPEQVAPVQVDVSARAAHVSGLMSQLSKINADETSAQA